MVDATRAVWKLWNGTESHVAAVRTFGGIVCGHAGESGGDGLFGQADDDEPLPASAENVVAAAIGGSRFFIRSGDAQCFCSGTLILSFPSGKEEHSANEGLSSALSLSANLQAKNIHAIPAF